MIELGDRVETAWGFRGVVAASPRGGKGWLVIADNGKMRRLWDEDLAFTEDQELSRLPED